VAGGQEKALIRDADDAEYSPDGRYIYFDSQRGEGTVRRARADGRGAERVISGEMANFFPHVSPDGKWLAFLSVLPQTADVLVRVMSLADGEIRVMGNLGSPGGTMKAPCWSPDSKRLTFVSYQEF